VLDEAVPHGLLVHLRGPLQLGQRLELVDGIVGYQHGLGQPLDRRLVAQLARVFQEHQVAAHCAFGIIAKVRRRHRRMTLAPGPAREDTWPSALAWRRRDQH
jgi:hypothetical protein